MKYILFISLTFFSGLCSRFNTSNNEEPLAQVGNHYLYPSDLKGLMKSKLSKEDSISMVTGLVEKWIRKQLIIQKAELNLTDEEKDVNKELEEYRSSLVIYKYEQKLIKEKLDTVVGRNEIEDYYTQNQSNFTLNYDAVKAVYIKLPIKSPDIDRFRIWFKSNSDDSYRQLDSYCFQYASKYEYFNDKWVDFDHIKILMPSQMTFNDQILRNTKYFEGKDSAYFYFLNIKEYQPKGSLSPLQLIENDIYSIILLKRKQKLINDMENKIYFDAYNHSNFTIFENKK